VKRFEREAHAIAALNHSNICQIYDVGPVMPDLAQLLALRTPPLGRPAKRGSTRKSLACERDAGLPLLHAPPHFSNPVSRQNAGSDEYQYASEDSQNRFGHEPKFLFWILKSHSV
jgi:hypothetical protein